MPVTSSASSAGFGLIAEVFTPTTAFGKVRVGAINVSCSFEAISPSLLVPINRNVTSVFVSESRTRMILLFNRTARLFAFDNAPLYPIEGINSILLTKSDGNTLVKISTSDLPSVSYTIFSLFSISIV